MNRDPYPICDDIRELAPAAHNPRNDMWMVGSYEVCRKILGDEDQFAPETEFFTNLFGAEVMEGHSGARHDELRGIWNPDLHRAAVPAYTQMVHDVVGSLVRPAVERMRDGEEVDFVDSVNRLIPAVVIGRLFGIPPEDVPAFVDWSNEMALFTEVWTSADEDGLLLDRAEKGRAAMKAYVAELIAADRAGAPTNGRVLAVQAPDHVSMTEEELKASVTQLIWGGHETTSKLMSHILVTLAEHPDQRRMLVEDRAMIPQAIEEILRWVSVPSSNLRRVRGNDADVQGVTVPDGSKVMVLAMAANRDPARWEDPSRLDVTRAKKTHLTFGFGTHSCIGLNLVRLETRLYLEMILDEIPEYELAMDEIDYGTNFLFRGPKEVRLTA